MPNLNTSKKNSKKNGEIPKKTTPKQQAGPQNNATVVILLIALLFSFFYFNRAYFTEQQLTYGEFFSALESNKETGQIEAVTLQQESGTVYGKFSDGGNFRVVVPQKDPELVRLLEKNIEPKNFSVKPPNMLSQILFAVLPMIILIFIFWFFFIRKAAQEGKRIFSFGQSRPSENTGSRVNITFADVAGVNEAKEELQEIIDFLKEPKRFQRLGGKIPKGVLLMGPPGCGKTLLAKAVSGEAGVPFFSISGSDFVEMFVGVGASRVRDLFNKARKSAKLSGKGGIIFIDEIDAVGRQRFAGIGGGHDEREQTLNQLLSEMDGFNTQEGVILIAATNRPDVLDPALLRPGRFDRQIVVDSPDIKGREAILKVHARNIKLKADVDLAVIARRTPGFSGADLANLVNEAALLAARNNKKAVELEEMEAAIERVIAGPERKSRVISDCERSLVAYHESGHALLALLINEVDPLHKVSIIPRGAQALGYTLQLPLEDRYIITQKELFGRLVVLLGGRVSEEIILNEISTGAQNDLEVATQIARKMVCSFGMSPKLGNLALGHRKEHIFLGRDIAEERNYSEETARLIDSELKLIIDEAYAKAKLLLSQHKEGLKKLAEKLKEDEILYGEQVKELVGLGNEDKNTDSQK